MLLFGGRRSLTRLTGGNTMKGLKTIVLLVVAACLWALGVSGQTHVLPYPYIIPGPPPMLMGPAGGLIYGMTQAPRYAVPDTRQWTDENSHRQKIRSWTLQLFNGPRDGVPAASVSGFCSVPSALIHARRYFPSRYSMTTPSPLPCWRMDGMRGK